MEEPQAMMNLGDEARTLIDLARDAHDPDERDRARVRTALASRLGAAAGLGLVAGVGAAAKVGAATGAGATAKAFGAGAAAVKALGAGTAAVKLIGAAVLVSATLGLGATAIHRARHSQVASVVAKKAAPFSHRGLPVVAKAAPSEASSPREVSAPASEQDEGKVEGKLSVRSFDTSPAVTAIVKTAPNAKVSASGRPARVGATEGSAEAGAGHAEVPVQRPTPAVADEARLVHDGVVALRSGELERALALFDTHALLHPQGILAEERDAERALTLAELGRSRAARAAIEQFLGQYPESPFAGRLRERGRLLDLAHP
jgi:hypothetical protein